MHEFARQIYRLRSDLHDLICSFLWDLQEFRFTSFQKGRDYHWFATFETTRSTLICNKTVTFFKKMKASWSDFALVDNLEKALWKISEKKSYFQKNYASSKAKELTALLNPVPVLICIINVFPFNERLNSKCFLSFQQNSIYQCN